MNWVLLKNSLLVAGGSAFLAAWWGFAVALFSATLNTRARQGVMALALAAFALPPFLATNAWLHFFGLSGTLSPYIPLNLYSLHGTILLIALQLWPISFFFIQHGLARIDRAYLELDPLLAGQSLAGHVIWPAVRSGFWQSAAVCFVLGLNSFSVPALLQTKVYAAEVWLSFNTQFDYLEAIRLSWPLILGPLALLAVLRARRMPFVFRQAQFAVDLFRERLGSLRQPAALISIAVIGLSVVMPLTQLLLSARTWAELLPAIAAGRAATANSIMFAVGAAALVVALSVVLQRRKLPVLCWFFFLTPGVLLGIALIWAFNRPAFALFYSSVAIVIFAYVLRFIAFGWSGFRLGVAMTDPAPLEIVRAFGGTRWQQFKLAVWPQTRTMLLAAFLLVYLMSLWEVETLILIVPPGRETLALRVFNMLHYGHAGQVNALCLWLLCLALAPLLVAMIGTRLIRILPAFALLLVSCSQPAPGTRIKSELFSSVQVIGTRGTGPGQFNKPRSLAVDGEDNLYVVDLTGRVQKFTPDGQYVLMWQMPQTDAGKPKGMVKDSEGNVIVIEPHYSRVNHFDPTGRLLAQWGTHGTNAGQVTFPRSAAVNSREEIYLSEYGQVERVLRFTRRGESFINVIGSAGRGDGEFNRPEGVGVGPDDLLHVADSCNHRVQIFTPEGKFLTAFGRAGSGAGEMSYPYDVRIDDSGVKFVCEFGNSRVQIFDQQNRPIGMLGGPGREPGQMNNPWSIALDSAGNLYVADSGNHRVQKFIRREPVRALHTKVQESKEKRGARNGVQNGDQQGTESVGGKLVVASNR